MTTTTKIEALPQIKRRKRVAAYARVSVDNNAMLHSLSAQVEYYTTLIQKRFEWEFVGVYADDPVSGTKDTRAEFQRLLTDCREGKIDMIITKSISRFARNTLTMLEVVRELKTLDVDIYFERENIHSMSDDGELLLTILTSFAQEESLSVSENCKWRIRKQMERGEPVGFYGMYGYEYKDGEIVVNEQQAAVIRQIFCWYLDGLGAAKIAQKLNEQNIPALRGGKWNATPISRLTSNEKLTGNSMLQKKFSVDYLTKRQVYNRGEKPRYFVEGTHPAIIDVQTFEAAQLIRRQRINHFNIRDTSMNRYPFSGKIICEQCGKHYKRRKGVGKFYWHCSTYLLSGKDSCSAKQIPESILIELAGQDFESIRVPDAGVVKIIMPDGTEIEKSWQYPSRRESWTEEMKQTARERQNKIIEERR